MQKAMIIDCDRLFAGNYRCTRVNQFSPNPTRVNSDYLKCLKTSRKLLKGLEHSLAKTRQYEDALARCRRDHDCTRHHSGKAINECRKSDQKQ